MIFYRHNVINFNSARVIFIFLMLYDTILKVLTFTGTKFLRDFVPATISKPQNREIKYPPY